MGRVARYKRIKAVDPFAKPSRRAAVASAPAPPRDLAPVNTSADAVPRRMAELLRMGESAGSRTGDSEAGRKRPREDASFKHLRALPGESMRAFAKRVDAERKRRLTEIRRGGAAPGAEDAAVDAKDAPAAATAPARLSKTVVSKVTEADGELEVHTLKPAEALDAIDVLERPDVLDITPVLQSGVADGSVKRTSGKASADEPLDITSLLSAGMKRRFGTDSQSFFSPAGASAAAAQRKKAREATAAGGSSLIQAAPDEFPVDVIGFNERVDAPPTLKVVPRMSKRQKDAMALAAASSDAASQAQAALEHAQKIAAGKAKGADGTAVKGIAQSKALAEAEKEVALATKAAEAARQAERVHAVAEAQKEETRTQVLAAYHALNRRKRLEAKAARSGGAAAASASFSPASLSQARARASSARQAVEGADRAHAAESAATAADRARQAAAIAAAKAAAAAASSGPRGPLRAGAV